MFAIMKNFSYYSKKSAPSKIITPKISFKNMTVMKLFLAIIGASLLFPFSSSAQKLELGVFGGLANYQGDLAPVAFTLRETKPAYGLVARYNINKFLTLRANAMYGRISGNDGKTLLEWRQIRNLSFETHIYEASLVSELHLFGYEDCGGKRFSPYAYFGLGIFNFNPKTIYNGQWVELQPLGTEGQGTSLYPERQPYKLTQVSVPFGGGIKFRVGRGLNLSAEIGWRKTFTDYLDDVSLTYVDRDILIAENGLLSHNLSNRSGEVLPSPINRLDGEQRGDPTDKDWYLFGGLILSYTFGTPCYNRSGVGCPSL